MLTLGVDPATGKRKQEWVSVKGTKKDAERKLTELLHQRDTGTLMKPGKTTVSEYLERWLTDYQNRLSARGYERYRDIIKHHLIPDLGQIKLSLLRPEHLQRHYTDCLNKGLNARTVRYHHAVVHVALKTALKMGLIVRNPADAVDLPKIHSKEMKTWDANQVSIFLEFIKDNQYHYLFRTALFTGMRRCELLGLKWGDVDFIMSQLSVSRGLHHLKDGSYVFTEPKSAKSRRTIALPPSVTLALRAYRQQKALERARLGKTLNEQDLVFSNPDGKPLRPNTVTRAFESLASRCGLPVIRLHDARHSHASIMLKQGIHPKIVQERLGHSSISMTIDTYSHVISGLQEAAAKRFDELFDGKAKDKIASVHD